MDYVALGKSNLMVSRVGFGAMSLEDVDTEENAAIMVHKAYDAGVNFFDISHFAQESEKRLGSCLHGIRQNVILATKSCVLDARDLETDLEGSLDALQSDYVDLFQYETSEKGLCDFNDIANMMNHLKEKGKILHYGITTENADTAMNALLFGGFETVQLQFNILTGEKNLKVVEQCAKDDVGFMAMQPLYGGLVRNLPLALGFLYQFENVVPLWGVRTTEELQQILYFNDHPPIVDEQFKEEVEKMRKFFS